MDSSGTLTRQTKDVLVTSRGMNKIALHIIQLDSTHFMLSDTSTYWYDPGDQITYTFEIINFDSSGAFSVVNSHQQLTFTPTGDLGSVSNMKYGIGMTNIGTDVYVRTCYTLHKGTFEVNNNSVTFESLPIMNQSPEYDGRYIFAIANKYPIFIDGHLHGTVQKYNIGQLYNNQWYMYVRDTNASTMAFALNSANPGENCKALVDGSAEYAGATRGFTKTPESEVEQDIYVYSPADGFVSAIPRKYRTIV